MVTCLRVGQFPHPAQKTEEPLKTLKDRTTNRNIKPQHNHKEMLQDSVGFPLTKSFLLHLLCFRDYTFLSEECTLKKNILEWLCQPSVHCSYEPPHSYLEKGYGCHLLSVTSREKNICQSPRVWSDSVLISLDVSPSELPDAYSWINMYRIAVQISSLLTHLIKEIRKRTATGNFYLVLGIPERGLHQEPQRSFQ